MASNYGYNFGFRRSDETLLVREGRYRVPASGTYRFGSLVAIDAANPGYLRAANPSEVGEGGTVGLLVQEEAHIGSIYVGEMVDTFSSRMNVAKNGALGVITSGAGGKVWLRNNAAFTQADGRVVAAVTMVDLTGLGPMDYLKWDGAKFVKSTPPNALATPVQSASSTATTGGTLAAGTYFYVVTAIDAFGETVKSNEISQATTGATSTVTVNWGAVTGATGYKIYRSTATGTETLLTTVGAVATFVDNGSLTPAATSSTTTPPLANTTGGSAVADSMLRVTSVNATNALVEAVLVR